MNPEDQFITQIPTRGMAQLIGAVFFTFAPIGLLVISSLTPERSPLTLAVVLALAGATAVAWVATFAISWRFIYALIACILSLVLVNIPPLNARLGIAAVELSPAGVALSMSIVVGYVLFLVFINGQGRRMITLREEMRLARDIHETLVPDINTAVGPIEAFGLSIPSTATGGDLIDLVEHDLGIDAVLVDVAGHGVKAGIVMGMVKASIHKSILDNDPIDKLVADLNRVLCTTLQFNLFATLAIMRFNRDASSAEVVLAGHHPVLRVTASGDIERIESRHVPVGVLDDSTFDTRIIQIASGDLIIAYTDGLSETADQRGNQFGHDAIAARLAAMRASPLSEIATGILNAAEAHGTTDDDRSILLIRAAQPAVGPTISP